STGARLLVDTAIVPGGRSDFLTVGTTSGVTSVAIRDTATTSFGAYNPTGIVIVNGVSHAGDFVLDSGSSFYNAGVFGGAIDKPGLFFSQLGVNGAGQTVLVSLPKVQAYQFSTLASQAQAVWYETAPRAARQAEVRDQLASGDGAGGFWVDVQGTHTARDVDRKSPTLAGIKSFDASYGQDVTAATIGYDAVRPMMNGDVVFGASVGYVNSSVDFDKQSTSVDMDGVSGAAYASFVRSGWFVAGTVGVTQLNAEIKAPRLTGFTEQETDITSIGATLEAGFRAPFIMGTTIEPTAALAYVNTSVDDFTAAGSTFRFEDGESLRPSIGARVSGDTSIGAGWATRYNVSVRAVGEALSENAITIGSAGPNLRVFDQFENAYGEVKAGLTSESVNGWSVFGDITGRYSDEIRAVGASVGMRLRY
ncbi:MAG TPA: autotransporter outer membrane beta-barrel domain-containing protein, partial [Brevundimonas sp.]